MTASVEKAAATQHAMRNRLRELMRTRESVLGPFVTLNDPAVVELAALAGFDFVVVELEHSGMSLETLQNHLRAAAALDIAAMVRVPSLDPKLILRVLDCGADGILVPHVGSAEDARLLVAAVRYPPLGHRGMSGGARSALYGAHGLGSVRELTQRLNEETVLAVMVEDAGAVAAIDSIVATRGIDLVHVGPSDLSASFDLLGTRDDPKLVAAVERVREACGKAGMKLGMPVEHGAYPRSAQTLRDEGAWLLTCGADAGYLLQAFRGGVARMKS